MSVITISRQMGSLGCDIAKILADCLDYRLVWRDLINQAARRAGIPEMALAAIDELGLLQICPSPDDCRKYREAVSQIMNEIADEGRAIIVGRAGQVILGNRPGVLHVLLVAPINLRIERIAKRHNISLECAKAQVEASDSYRSKYLRRFYHVRWDDPTLYHLVINTGKATVDQVSDVIQAVLRKNPTQESLSQHILRENFP